VDDIDITRLGWARHILGMEDERIHPEKKFTMKNSKHRISMKSKKKKGGSCPEG